MEFATALNRLRREAGLSLSALAKRANCSKSEVGHATTGARVPSDQLALAMDRALNANGLLVAIARSTRLRRRQASSPGGATDASLSVRLRLEGIEVNARFDRRDFLRSGAPLLIAALGLDPQQLHHEGLPTEAVISLACTVAEVVDRMREQWHHLVLIDNVRGPQPALDGVRNQLSLIDGLLQGVRGPTRNHVARIGAQYAESAAWLCEDLDDMTSARQWTSRAAEWSYEAADHQLLAWTMYRKAQQATAEHDPGTVIGLTSAILSQEDDLPAPMRAAIRVQQAHGHALDGDIDTAQRLLDDAHSFAATDLDGDARGGHGSFCTHSYIELNRATCLATVHQPTAAIDLFRTTLPTVPASYRRDRAAYQIKLAAAYAGNGDVEHAARCVLDALPAMSDTGSRRMIRQVSAIAEQLRSHRGLPVVADMLEATTASREYAS